MSWQCLRDHVTCVDATLLILEAMKKLVPSSLRILTYYCFFAHAAVTCFAMDDGGCLTCHKFAGLVRFEKPDGFKVLYIDEKAFLKSPHGKLSCRQCHVNVVKVPHTGETGVQCITTLCHPNAEEHTLTAKYPLSGFHKKEQSVISSFQDESSCRVCHPLYPHSENNMVRALLNMHTSFMICEVCHLKRDQFDDLTYERRHPEKTEFGVGRGSRYDEKIGRVQKLQNFIPRIAVFVTEKGKKRMLMNTWDIKTATEVILREENLKPHEKDTQLRYFHRDVARKEISVACDECHSSKSILDFSGLGFDEKRSNELIYLDLKGLVTKYKTFYFPDLFER